MIIIEDDSLVVRVNYRYDKWRLFRDGHMS